MKKLYILLAALAVTLTTQAARKITFYLGDQPIESGAEVNFNVVTENELTGNFQYAPELYAVSSTTTKKAYFEVECTTGQSIQVCAGGLCANGSHIIKENVSMSRNEKLPMKFEYVDPDAEDPAEMPKDIVVTFYGIDGTDQNSASEFTLFLGKDGSGIATVMGDKPEVRMARGQLLYKVTGKSTLTLYNILGVRALQVPISDAGTISLEGLPKGIYVYTVEGDTTLSGKIRF